MKAGMLKKSLDRYHCTPSLILGFHGCDKFTWDKVITGGECLSPSTNDYDWLGTGIYFWEHDPLRAMEWAEEQGRDNSKYVPSVIGAVIDLGRCLNLLERRSIRDVLDAHDSYISLTKPEERLENKSGPDKKARYLDCSVIEIVHRLRESRGFSPYDSVRGLFPEGKELYPYAGFREKTHIQICIRNPDCILGYFDPREKTS